MTEGLRGQSPTNEQAITALQKIPLGLRKKLAPLAVYRAAARLEMLPRLLGIENTELEALVQTLEELNLAAVERLSLLLSPALRHALARELDPADEAKAVQMWQLGMDSLALALHRQVLEGMANVDRDITLVLEDFVAVAEAFTRRVVVEKTPNTRIWEFVTRVYWLVSQIAAPRELTRIRSILNTLTPHMPPWSHATCMFLLEEIDSAPDPREALSRALRVHVFASVFGNVYPEAPEDLLRCTVELARALMFAEYRPAAARVLEKAHEQFATLRNAGRDVEKIEIEAQVIEALVLFSLDKHPEAAVICEKLIPIFQQRNVPHVVASLQSRLGVSYFIMRKHREAVQMQQQALRLFVRLGNKAEMAQSLYQLGLVHIVLNELHNAGMAFEEAQELLLELGDLPRAAEALAKRGECFGRAGNDEPAAEWALRAAALFAEIGNAHEAADQFCFAGVYLTTLGRLDEARQALRRSIGLSKDWPQRFRPWAALVDLERDAGNPEAMETAYLEAADLYLTYRREGGKPFGAGPEFIIAVSERLNRQGPEAADELLRPIDLEQPGLARHQIATVRALKQIVAGNRDAALVEDRDIPPQNAVEILALLETAPTAPEDIDRQAAWDASNRLYEQFTALPDKRSPVALELTARAHSLRIVALGPQAPRLSVSLNILANVCRDLGDHANAQAALEHSLALQEAAYGPEHVEVASALHRLGVFHFYCGALSTAEPLYLRALALREKLLDANDFDLAMTYLGLGQLLRLKEDLERAEPLLLQALAILEKVSEPALDEMSNVLNELALLQQARGDFQNAAATLRRSIAIKEKLADNAVSLGFGLNNLGELHRIQGDYLEAERLHLRALVLRKKAFGPEHRDVAQSLNNLALLQQAMNNLPKAEEFFQQALAGWEKSLGPEHPEVAVALYNLGRLYERTGNFDKVIPLEERALAIREKAFGPEHPTVAQSTSSLATVQARMGNMADAERLTAKALAVREKTLGSGHPDVANSLCNLAHLYWLQDDYDRAEPLYMRALAIKEKAFGPEHPEVGDMALNVGIFHGSRGQFRQALQACARAVDIENLNAAEMLTVGSDAQKRKFMDGLRISTNTLLSLHCDSLPDDDEAKNKALELLLNRKGRALGAMSASFAALRRNSGPAQRERFEQLRAQTTAYVEYLFTNRLDLSAKVNQANEKHLDEEREKLEAEIARLGGELEGEKRPVTIAEITRAIPEGAALVEIFKYQPMAWKTRETRRSRYVAYVLRHEGKTDWLDLGEASVIESLVARLRDTLSQPPRDPKAADPRRSLREFDVIETESSVDIVPFRELDRLIMAPIRNLLGETKRFFICPDKELNLIPFAALVDEKGRYLAENYVFTYLTSGRDLLRLGQGTPAKGAPVVVSAPDYDAAATLIPGVSGPEPKRRVFAPLYFAAREGQTITRKLAATLLTGAEASKQALGKVTQPSLLHIATHGFYIAGQRTRAASGVGELLPARPELPPETALLMSGLALAGANDVDVDPGRGIMTALEVAQLDLTGTRLVVLSACVTGVGDVQSPDGVYGLRRALTVAGAETQMMSLWSVDDAATCELMESYYDKLLSGAGRSEALRLAQVEMLARPDRVFPFYWASFIVSGDDSPIRN